METPLCSETPGILAAISGVVRSKLMNFYPYGLHRTLPFGGRLPGNHPISFTTSHLSTRLRKEHPLFKASPFSDMSTNRSLWDAPEELLLRQVYSELPGAKLKQIWEAFHAQNHQYRSKYAVKAKMKDLGLSVVKQRRGKQTSPLASDMSNHDTVTMSTPPEAQLPSSSQPPSEAQCATNLPFIPSHPLIAEARRHIAQVEAVGYASSVFPTTRWAVILREPDIAGLRCTKADKAALRTYMRYLRE